MTGEPLVAVLLGTDHRPFDRLVDWTASLAATGRQRYFVQHGATRLPADRPSTLLGAPMLDLHALEDLLDQAVCVVTHGGPGLIMEARAAGHLPIVVPRRPELGEHVDGHQLRFCHRTAQTGFTVRADSCDELRCAVELAVLTGRRPFRESAGTDEVAARFGSLVAQLEQRRWGRR